MGYSGQTFQLPCSDMGFNHNANVDNVPPNSMVFPSKNVNINEGGIGKRGGTALADEYVMPGSPRIMGLFDYTPSNGAQWILRATGDGKLYTDQANIAVTGLAQNKHSSFCVMNDKAYMFNGSDVPRILDGNSASSLGQLSADWTGSAYPTQAIIHGSGNSERMWCIGVNSKTGGINLRNYVYYSKDNDGFTDAYFARTGPIASVTVYEAGTNYVIGDVLTLAGGDNNATITVNAIDDAGGITEVTITTEGAEYPFTGDEITNATGGTGTGATFYANPDTIIGTGQIYIETGRGEGLVAMVEYQDRLILFSKTNSFIINDTDADTSNWAYESSGWHGGAAHWRVVVNTPNDIVAMTDDGEIYSVSAAMTYGDYKSASLTRAAYVHKYIADYVDLAYIEDFHASYDSVLRCINFHVVRKGQTQIDTALVYFIDRTPATAWVIKDNQNYNSGWSASCSASIKEGSTNKVYTGDYSGYVWKLETNAKNDNGNGYYSGVKHPYLTFGNNRITKRYDYLRVIIKPIGNFDLNVKTSIDGAEVMTGVFSMAGTGVKLGSFILGTDVIGGNSFLNHELRIGSFGDRIQSEIYNSTANQDFFISQIQYDHKLMTVTP